MKFSRTFYLWILIFATLGSLNSFDLADEFLGDLRNRIYEKQASGTVMVIGIDQKDSAKTETSFQQLFKQLKAKTSANVYLVGNAKEISNLIESEETQTITSGYKGEIFLPAYINDQDNSKITFPKNTNTDRLHYSQVTSESFMFVRQLARHTKHNNVYIPSIAEKISNINNTLHAENITIDFAYSENSIPIANLTSSSGTIDIPISNNIQNIIVDVNQGQNLRKDRLPVVGSQAIIGRAHAYAAETLLHKEPYKLGFWFAFLVSILLATTYAFLQARYKGYENIAIYAQGLLFPALYALGFLGIYIDILIGVGFAIAWTIMAVRGKNIKHITETAATSKLPNFNNLVNSQNEEPKSLIAVQISHWNELSLISDNIQMGELAQQIAERLKHTNEKQTVWHNNASLFSIMLPVDGIELDNHLLGLRALFSTPFHLANDRVDINLIFGIDTNIGVDIEKRLAAACAAAEEATMSTADQSTYNFINTSDVQFSLSLHANIDDGLANDEIWVAYQPKLDLRNNEINSCEALLRWTHPERGPISPNEFVLEAEKTGRMEKLTELVLKDSARTAKKLIQKIPDINISVNLSTAILEKPAFLVWLSDVMQANEINPANITFEITETRKASSLDLVIEQLKNLKAMGFRLSLDDFGTGTANFELLVQLPVDEIKIDRMFVAETVTSNAHMATVKSCNDYAQRLGIDLVAEGVEDSAILAHIKDIGCAYGQGYHIAKPMNFFDFQEFSYNFSTKRKIG